jgi:hypothetical protein
MTNHRIDHQAIAEDLVAHLQARLGLADDAATLTVLGNWLASYEPGPAALARATPRAWAQRDAA